MFKIIKNPGQQIKLSVKISGFYHPMKLVNTKFDYGTDWSYPLDYNVEEKYEMPNKHKSIQDRCVSPISSQVFKTFNASYIDLREPRDEFINSLAEKHQLTDEKVVIIDNVNSIEQTNINSIDYQVLVEKAVFYSRVSISWLMYCEKYNTEVISHTNNIEYIPHRKFNIRKLSCGSYCPEIAKLLNLEAIEEFNFVSKRWLSGNKEKNMNFIEKLSNLKRLTVDSSFFVNIYVELSQIDSLEQINVVDVQDYMLVVERLMFFREVNSAKISITTDQPVYIDPNSPRYAVLGYKNTLRLQRGPIDTFNCNHISKLEYDTTRMGKSVTYLGIEDEIEYKLEICEPSSLTNMIRRE